MGSQANAVEQSWTLQNDVLTIVLSAASRGGLAALVDRQTGRNWVCAGAVPLFTLTLYQKGRELVELSSLDATTVSVLRSSTAIGEQLTLEYDGFGGLALTITCTVVLEHRSGPSRWRFSVRNGTGYGVRTIRYPWVVCPGVLGESDDDDYFIWGHAWHNLVHRPGRVVRRMARASRQMAEESAEEREESGAARMDYCPPGQYPGAVGVQFQAYYDATAGLSLATHDATGVTKQFGFQPAGLAGLEECVDLTIAHHYDERPGLNFALPYDTVIEPFHGDWYAAADLYKPWAYQQHWCSRKLSERSDIPEWLKEPRPHMMIITQGNVERARGTLWSAPADLPLAKFWPIRKVVPLMREYARIFGTPVSTWLEGWERIGSPGGPVDIFPPLEGDTSFKAATARLNQDGYLCWMYATGFQWCYFRSPTGYDGRERFRREGLAMAALNERGESDHFMFPNGQKHFASMCIGSADFRKLLSGNLMHLMDLGAVALQVDQQHGWFAIPCYSEAHGHPPGYGPWALDETRKWVQGVRKAAKARNADATLAQETPCEIWIQDMDIQMHRPYSVGSVDVFGYLYHEYGMTYGGDDMLGLSHPEVSLMKHARVCVLGQQNLVGIGEPEYDIQVEELDHPVLPLLKEICAAQRTFGRKYLVFGQVLRPAEIAVGTLAVERWTPISARASGGFVDMPLVERGTFGAADGQIGTVLVNWSGSPQQVTLAQHGTGAPAWLVTSKGQRPIAPEEAAQGKLTLTIAARSVALVEGG